MSVETISTKIVIIGEPAVGKTTMRMSFTGKKMEGNYLMTMGADVALANLQITPNVMLEAQLWDIAGQANFKPITKDFLKSAQGAVLVFDLTRPETFDEISSWLELLHENNPQMENDIPFIIVGNKEDLEQYIKVNDDDVKEYIDYLNRHNVYSQTDTEYVKTSAKTGYRIKEAFHRLGRIIVKNYNQVMGTDYELGEFDLDTLKQTGGADGTTVDKSDVADGQDGPLVSPEEINKSVASIQGKEIEKEDVEEDEIEQDSVEEEDEYVPSWALYDSD